jgi:tetratricopeptide (TPR) repeat protein
MSSKFLVAALLALVVLAGCGGPRSPFIKQVEKVDKYTDRGDEKFNQGNLPLASKEFNRALTLSRGMDYQPGVARQLNNLGAVALEKGDLPRARELFTRAWEVNRSQENWAEASTNQANLATVAQQAGDLDAVRLHLTQTENAARWSRNKSALARAYMRWSGFALDQLDFGLAESYLKLAKRLARTPAVKAAVAYQRGRLALARGDTPAAVNYLSQALSGDRELQDRAAMAADLYHLGEAYRLRGDWYQAFRYYARAFDVYASMGRQARLRECLARLQEANREGSLNQPLDRFEKHLKAVKRRKDDQRKTAGHQAAPGKLPWTNQPRRPRVVGETGRAIRNGK